MYICEAKAKIPVLLTYFLSYLVFLIWRTEFDYTLFVKMSAAATLTDQQYISERSVLHSQSNHWDISGRNPSLILTKHTLPSSFSRCDSSKGNTFTVLNVFNVWQIAFKTESSKLDMTCTTTHFRHYSSLIIFTYYLEIICNSCTKHFLLHNAHIYVQNVKMTPFCMGWYGGSFIHMQITILQVSYLRWRSYYIMNPFDKFVVTFSESKLRHQFTTNTDEN